MTTKAVVGFEVREQWVTLFAWLPRKIICLNTKTHKWIWLKTIKKKQVSFYIRGTRIAKDWHKPEYYSKEDALIHKLTVPSAKHYLNGK